MVEAISLWGAVVFISMMCMCIYRGSNQSVGCCSIYIYDVYVYISWKQSVCEGL